jgi:hypothetical protein
VAKRRHLFALLLICVLAAVQSPGDADLGSFTGSERNLWSSSALVVARIASVSTPDRSNPFDVVGTLRLDIQGVAFTESLVPTSIAASYRQGRDSSVTGIDFSKDATMLMVLRQSADGKWDVDSNLFEFMPNGFGACSVKGVDDERVANTLEKLRSALKIRSEPF